MKIVYVILIIGLTLFKLTGCITTSYNESIIEKSKQVRPSWLDQETSKIILKEDKTNFIYFVDSENELALTIRESQPTAKKEFLQKIDDGFTAMFLKSLKDSNTEYDLSSNYFNKPYQNFLDKVLHKHMDIADIYFEKVLIENSESTHAVTTTYRVWVYLVTDNNMLRNEVKKLSDYYLARKTPQLRHIGATLSKLKLKDLF